MTLNAAASPEPQPPVRAFVGLGANIGDPAAHLADALESLGRDGVLVACSNVYRSAPIGPAQPEFLNLAAELAVTESPRQLLARCQALEAAAGRVRLERWGPRTLDVDVLIYGDLAMREPDLVIPHPRMRQRRFVLAPLAELAPELVTVGDLAAVSDQDCERICSADGLRALSARQPPR